MPRASALYLRMQWRRLVQDVCVQQGDHELRYVDLAGQGTLVIRTSMGRSQEKTSQKDVQIRLWRRRPGALSRASQTPFRPKDAVSTGMDIGVTVIAKVIISTQLLSLAAHLTVGSRLRQ